MTEGLRGEKSDHRDRLSTAADPRPEWKGLN